MTSDSRLVYWNGRLIPEADARLSIYDSALMFGDMVFEMTRSFNGVQFKLRDHLERLYASMKAVCLTPPIAIERMEDAVNETIEANRPAFGSDDEYRVMIDVSRGLLSIYEGIGGVAPGPNVIIAVFPLRWTVAGMGRLFDSGINAVVPSQRAIPAHLLDPKIKNRSRLHYLMANVEASRCQGEDNWALLLDPDGLVAEGTGDNFFIVRDGRLLTPKGRNILRGISRAYVMEELAPALGLEAVEQDIEPYDVLSAREAFMTGTPFCLLPVCRLNGQPIGDGQVGSLTRRLIERWSSNVGLDIARQIQAWDAEGGSLRNGATPYSFNVAG